MKMRIEHRWNDTDRGNRSAGRKTCHSDTLSTANLTWAELGSNPDLRFETPEPRHAHLKAKINQSFVFPVNGAP
jgi:hypothetical protein